MYPRELFEVRKNLKNLKKKENADLFVILYRSWCHNPCATLSLCLLACVYEQGTLLIGLPHFLKTHLFLFPSFLPPLPHCFVGKFAELEITVGFLVEIDKLVQLIESPIFTSLRLQVIIFSLSLFLFLSHSLNLHQLLEPHKYPYLYKCLYGLLMLLPQSGAFETLRNRLSCTPPPSLLPPPSPSEKNQKLEIDFEPLLLHFVEMQDR